MLPQSSHMSRIRGDSGAQLHFMSPFQVTFLESVLYSSNKWLIRWHISPEPWRMEENKWRDGPEVHLKPPFASPFPISLLPLHTPFFFFFPWKEIHTNSGQAKSIVSFSPEEHSSGTFRSVWTCEYPFMTGTSISDITCLAVTYQGPARNSLSPHLHGNVFVSHLEVSVKLQKNSQSSKRMK